jgi:predicted transcriptional regulator
VAKTEDLKERGIRLVLVRVLLEGESTDQAKGVLRSWGVYRDFVVDRNGAVQKQLNLGKLPATVVVDRQARLKWVAPGDATAEDVEAAARVVAKEGP